jgi:hypothetical protein
MREIAEAHQVNIPRRATGDVVPEGKEHRPLEHKGLGVTGGLHSIQQTFQSVAQQQVVELLPGRVTDIEQSLVH